MSLPALIRLAEQHLTLLRGFRAEIRAACDIGLFNDLTSNKLDTRLEKIQTQAATLLDNAQSIGTNLECVFQSYLAEAGCPRCGIADLESVPQDSMARDTSAAAAAVSQVCIQQQLTVVPSPTSTSVSDSEKPSSTKSGVITESVEDVPRMARTREVSAYHPALVQKIDNTVSSPATSAPFELNGVALSNNSHSLLLPRHPPIAPSVPARKVIPLGLERKTRLRQSSLSIALSPINDEKNRTLAKYRSTALITTSSSSQQLQSASAPFKYNTMPPGVQRRTVIHSKQQRIPSHTCTSSLWPSSSIDFITTQHNRALGYPTATSTQFLPYEMKQNPVKPLYNWSDLSGTAPQSSHDSISAFQQEDWLSRPIPVKIDLAPRYGVSSDGQIWFIPYCPETPTRYSATLKQRAIFTYLDGTASPLASSTLSYVDHLCHYIYNTPDREEERLALLGWLEEVYQLLWGRGWSDHELEVGVRRLLIGLGNVQVQSASSRSSGISAGKIGNMQIKQL